MKLLFLLISFFPISVYANSIKCDELSNQITNNSKQIASYQSLDLKYALKTGNMKYLDSTKSERNELKSENSMLFQQYSSLKCKPFKGDLTGKSFKNSADLCLRADESDPQKEKLCDQNMW